MARAGKGAAGAKPPGVLDIDIPEIPGRNPHAPPTQHLVKVDATTWRPADGRRISNTLLVNRIRREVDAWRGHYRGASATSRELLRYWFDEDHILADGNRFRFYFCQREAMETLIYLREVKGIRDCMPLLDQFYEDPDGAQLEFARTTRKERKLRRYVPELGKSVEQDLPREGLARFSFKMATGSGKTVVMALAIAWSYFHRRREAGSDLADNFLVLAPGLIVYERLKLDFEGGKIFRNLPIIPTGWESDWHVETILRGDPRMPAASGNIFVNNIHQIYDDEADADDEPINPIARILGKAPPANIAAPERMLDRIRRVRNLMVLNDEAHHLHDDNLKWNETLLGLDDHLRPYGGVTAWLDFSATPKNQYGTFYPWNIVDYPLAQAVEDGIVKVPLIVHEVDKRDPVVGPKVEAGEAYADWIEIAVSRWREHSDTYEKSGEKPILFVMAETTKDADSVAARLELEPDLKGRVLVIHVNEKGKDKGEIAKIDQEKARKAAREIDGNRSHYRAVVSVLMLREGWDVRNVTVILGLRPFSAEAKILPEQAVGRGLRLMRKIPADNPQVLEVIGTKAFEDFVKELEKEGLGIGVRHTPPKPGVHIYPVEDRREYDIVIPRTTALLEREYRNIDQLDPLALPAILADADLERELRHRIELVYATLDVKLADRDVAVDEDKLPLSGDLIAALVADVMKRAKLPVGFNQLYPRVEAYVRDRCFNRTIDLDSVAVRRFLNDGAVLGAIGGLISRKVGELTAVKRDIRLTGEPYRLSETEQFTWRRKTCDADRTVFNQVACYNEFEADFARMLDGDRAGVASFAKLCEWFTGFHVQYIKSGGAMGLYYPDFVVVQRAAAGPAYWIIETKGQEDVEVATKDAQMMRWCDEVSVETGAIWDYRKVPYELWRKHKPRSFAQLLTLLDANAAATQVVLPIAAPATAAAGPAPRPMPSEPAKILPFRKVAPREGEHFKTCVPLVPLAAAAGVWGAEHVLNVLNEAEDWIEPPTRRSLLPGMFVAQVVGRSMEPRIQDGDYCLFGPISHTPDGQVVLARHRLIHDPENHADFTVKVFHAETADEGDGNVRQTRVMLMPLNVEFRPVVITPKDERDEVQVLAQFLEVLRPSPPAP